MPHVSYDELTSTLQKSGLPLGNSVAMQQATPFGRQAIQGQVFGQDTQLSGFKNEYKSKLDALAQADQKLGAVYSDPSSKLYIEHPLQRERLLTGGPRATGQKELGRVTDMYKSREKDLDDQVEETFSLYKQLENLQSQEEARIKRLEKEMAKGAKKGSQAAKGISDKISDSKNRKYELESHRLSLAGIENQGAADAFLKKTKPFQEQFIRDYQLVKDKVNLPGGWQPSDIDKAFKEFDTKKILTPKKAPKTKTNNLDKLKQAFGIK